MQAVQETPKHIHIPLCIFPPRRCTWAVSVTSSEALTVPQGLNTTGTLISICQNDKFQFSFLQNTYLGLSQAITSTISTMGFWYIQRYYKISTKKMVRIPLMSKFTTKLCSVCRNKRRHDDDTFLGYAWNLDHQNWVSQRLGVLVSTDISFGAAHQLFFKGHTT